jgi:hypothetical protein
VTMVSAPADFRADRIRAKPEVGRSESSAATSVVAIRAVGMTRSGACRDRTKLEQPDSRRASSEFERRPTSRPALTEVGADTIGTLLCDHVIIPSMVRLKPDAPYDWFSLRTSFSRRRRFGSP